LTLAAYAIEGKAPKTISTSHGVLRTDHAASILKTGRRDRGLQIDSGAQVVQMFDSWQGSVPKTSRFALAYQRRVEQVKATHPDTPLILYINGSAGLERMARSGVDLVSVDWTVDMKEARDRLGANIGVQGFRPMCFIWSERVYP